MLCTNHLTCKWFQASYQASLLLYLSSSGRILLLDLPGQYILEQMALLLWLLCMERFHEWCLQHDDHVRATYFMQYFMPK